MTTYQFNDKSINLSPVDELKLQEQFEIWCEKATKSAKMRLRKVANKHNIPNYIYLYLRDEQTDNVEAWTVGLSKQQRAKVRKLATIESITYEEALEKIKQRRAENEKSQKLANRSKDRSNAKRELKSLAEGINSDQLNFDTSNVEVIGWDSNQMKEIIEEDTSYKLAKGIVLGLMNGKESLKHNTFNGMSEKEIVDKTLKLIDKSDKMYPIEEKFSSKVGNLRSLPFKEWIENVIALWTNVEFNPNGKVLNSAVQIVEERIKEALYNLEGEEFIIPLSIENALIKVTKGRNSGYPYYTSKWSENDEIVNYYKTEALEILNGKAITAPRILFKRVQNNGETPKMRPVECPPKSEAIAAKVFTDKLVEAFKLDDQFCGFNGNTQIDAYMRKMFDYQYLLSSDFSKFDTTAQNFIPIIFDMMKRLTFKHYESYFENLKEYYLKSELITPIGIVKGKEGVRNGLQSGDGWTSIIGTVTNAIANEYYKLMTGNASARVLSFGDDCVIASKREIDVKLYADIMAQLGMICNPEKQEQSKDYFSFLGFYYFREDINKSDGKLHIFPIMRALPKLIYQETPISFDKTVQEAVADGLTGDDLKEVLNANKLGIDLLAHLQKLENCKNNAAFEEFVRFFRNHEPNKMATKLIKPVASLKNYIKNNRRNRKDGIINSVTYQLLLSAEYQEEINSYLYDEKPINIIKSLQNQGFESESIDNLLGLNIETKSLELESTLL